MKYIATLLTVHNRKEKTLACLANLYKQLPIPSYQTDVYLTDDGCTDGTSEAVKAKFPQVHIIKGDGNLFWNRGMYTAWKAAAETWDYDFYLWLNDDTFLFEHAISTLLEDASKKNDQSIIIAPITSKFQNVTTYSGHNQNGMITPNGHLQECDTFNGNCVLIPKYVFKKVGNLDWKFKHAIGDMDYGYRARRIGLHNYVSATYLGTCENNPLPPAWTRKEVPLKKRICNLYSPLGYAEPIPFFLYEKRNFGILTAIKHFFTIHVRVLFPQLWKK